ncbi:MAG: hypothetical protein Aurels2KO_47090 [Aureliella sp.]
MKNLNPVDNYLHGSWEALGAGAPMMVALAQLASESWVNKPSSQPLDKLSLEAQAILFAARDHGMIEIRAVNSAFEASARMLAVYVEASEERTIAFRDSERPETTLRFLGGFRELCAAGLVLHHIARDFSIAPDGFHLANQVDSSAVAPLLDLATEFGLHDE